MFLAKGAKTYQIRVDHPDGRHVVLSSGTRDEELAADVERLVRVWQGRGPNGPRAARPDVLDALVEKRISLPEAYDAFGHGELAAVLAANTPPELSTAVDLMPRLEAFVAEKRRAKKGAGQADTYRREIVRLYPEGLTLSNFTRREVWSRIEALDVEAPTRNRIRTACSMFARFLVKLEVLETNFVRDIGGDMFGENDPRLIYYELADAKQLIAGLAQPYAAIAAFALGFAAEWGAITRSVVGDFSLETDPVTARVRGSKRTWRDRVVPLVPELAWTLEYIRPAMKNKVATAKLVEDVPEWRVIDVQRATAAELKLHAVGEDAHGEHSIHDWRHTHAVALLRAGYLEQIVADHLGHKDTTVVRKVYGRFKPTRHDYAKSITSSITSGSKPRVARGAKSRRRK